MSKPDRELHPGEAVVYRARPSRLELIPPLAAAFAALAVGAIGWRMADSLWPLMIGGVGAAVGVALAAARAVQLATLAYVLTDRRLILRSGLLTRVAKDSYLDKVNNVEHRRTLLGRLLGYGDVEVDTASDEGCTIFPRVADPLGFQRAILEASHAARQRSTPRVASGADRLRELEALYAEKLVSEAEYQRKRAELLDAL